LGTTDLETAKERLTAYYLSVSRPVVAAEEIGISEVMLRYWVRHAESLASASSIRPQLGYWNKFFGEGTVAEALTYARLEAFKEWLTAKGLAPVTVNHVLALGRAALRMAHKRQEIAAVPPITLMKVGEQEPMGRPLTVAECAKILDCSPPHIRQLCLFLMGTAARPAAIIDMCWGQIDREHLLVNLNPEGRKQNKKHRPIVNLVPTLAAIPEYGTYVIEVNGKRVRSVKTAWRKVRTRAGLDEDVTLYSFRHTMGRWMRSQRVPIEQIQEQLGHRLSGVTGRYAPYAPGYLDKASAAIEDFIRLVLNSATPDAWSDRTRIRPGRSVNPVRQGEETVL
jgi:integrase